MSSSQYNHTYRSAAPHNNYCGSMISYWRTAYVFLSKKNVSNLLIKLYILLLMGINIYRITIGVDLSDEAYYATFLDEWLKLGLSHSANLMIHQTAAFLLFPFAYIYKLLIGGEVGLILFLRAIYLFLSLGSMAVLSIFINKYQGKLIAALIFGFGFLFIPFSLPAPSYNTIGMFGMLSAISLFGLAIQKLAEKNIINTPLPEIGNHSSSQHLPLATCLQDPVILNKAKSPSTWLDRFRSHGQTARRSHLICQQILVGSSFLWICSIIAYPSLLIALIAFVSLAFFLLPNERSRSLIKYYSFYCLLFLMLAAVVFYLIFGATHLREMLKFSDTVLHVSDGLSRKTDETIRMFTQNKIFSLLCMSSFLIGVCKGVLNNKTEFNLVIYAFIGAVVFYSFTIHSPVLFLQSHDMIFIFVLLGVYIPIQHLNYPVHAPIINVMYLSSVFAGLLTSVTATHGLLNFPIGGLTAACLTMAFIDSSISPKLVETPTAKCGIMPEYGRGTRSITNIIVLILTNTSLIFCSYKFIYGEIYGHPLDVPSKRIQGGVFAGLLTSSEQFKLIHRLNEILPQEATTSKSILAIGRLPGIYLLTPLSAKILTSWNFDSTAGKDFNQIVTDFYQTEINQPDFLFRYVDQLTNKPLAIEYRLVSKYELVRSICIKNAVFLLYKKPRA